MALSNAEILGTACSTPSAFAHCIVSAVQEYPSHADCTRDLLLLWLEIQKYDGEFLYRFIDKNIWVHSVRTAFFLQYPMDFTLMRMTSHDKVDIHAIRFLNGALMYGADPTRIALVIVPFFARILPLIVNKPLVGGMANVLRRLGEMDDINRELLMDPRLLRELSMCMISSANLCDIVEFAHALVGACDDTSALKYILVAGVTCLTSSARTIDRPTETTLFKFMTSLANIGMQWEPFLADACVKFARKGWPVESAHLVKALIQGSSVYLLVKLARSNLLHTLYETLSMDKREKNCPITEEERQLWSDVLTILDSKWPQMGVCIENKEGPVTMYICPITLSGCHDPVVASDGHTYERKSILQHMVQNGMCSPMTKQTLNYHLFPNWALQRE